MSVLNYSVILFGSLYYRIFSEFSQCYFVIFSELQKIFRKELSMIYQNIKSIADSKGISVRKIEQDTGIVLGSIYHWNDVKPSVDKVAKVAKYLGVTVEELLKE